MGGEHSHEISVPQLLWFGIDSALNIFPQTIAQSLTYLNDKAVYRTAPATPGLLNIWLLNIQCSWMIHCTNLKRFPQYLKCPRVNHSITSDENSPRPPCERPGIPSRGPASLWVTSSVSKWMGGRGSRSLLENVQKEAAFSLVWLPLVNQGSVINATGLSCLVFKLPWAALEV